jgi:hypothetical protein
MELYKNAGEGDRFVGKDPGSAACTDKSENLLCVIYDGGMHVQWQPFLGQMEVKRGDFLIA